VLLVDYRHPSPSEVGLWGVFRFLTELGDTTAIGILRGDRGELLLLCRRDTDGGEGLGEFWEIYLGIYLHAIYHLVIPLIR
jgi:hypothetical protein